MNHRATWDLIRASMLKDQPWLARALYALRGPRILKDDRVLGAVSQYGGLFLSELVFRQPYDFIRFIATREVWHLLLEHFSRRVDHGVPDEDLAIKIWQHAADMEICNGFVSEELLRVASLSLENLKREQIWTSKKLGYPDNLSAEAYYRLIWDDVKSGRIKAVPAGLPTGSAADGVPRDFDGMIPSKISAAQRKEIQKSTAQEAAKHAGTLPGLDEWAIEINKPAVIDWRRVLRAAIVPSLTSGWNDNSYSRPFRRDPRGDRGYLSPGNIGGEILVAVVRDTSGSMLDGSLETASTEVLGIARSVGGRVVLTDCDSETSKFREVRTATDLARVSGGGGTDMSVGIEAAASLKPRPSIVVVLTDGYTPWPEAQPKGVHVVAGVIGSIDSVPKWITAIQIPREEES